MGAPWCQVFRSERDDNLTAAAGRLMTGNLEVLGRTVQLPRGIPDWNRDPVGGIELPRRFGLFIDPRHVEGDVDIKYLWELNRHLWWVTLAQAYAVTGDSRFADRLAELIDSWIEACPYPLGPNWSSPVEHGIRLINWSLVWHLLGGKDAPIFSGEAGHRRLQSWFDCIYRHIRFAHDNYSFFSSADNHLIGEAAGIYVAARTWDLWADVRALGVEAKSMLEREIVRQFAEDGVNREQAIAYHKFALQFLLAAGLCGRADGDAFSDAFWQRLEKGLVFLAAIMDCTGGVPSIGDGDDSDVYRFHQGSDRSGYTGLLAVGAHLFPASAIALKWRQLGLRTDPAAAWLLGLRLAEPPDVEAPGAIPTRFEHGGYLILGDRLHQPDEIRIVLDVGPLGYNRVAGHGHADALAVHLSYSGENLLVDPGTYCYNSDPEMRRFFRSTGAHNTIVVDDRDQAEYGGSFLWLTDVSCALRSLHVEGETVVAEAAHDGYVRLADPVVHCRRVIFNRQTACLEVQDWLECRQEHDVVVFWHLPPGVEVAALGPASWRVASGPRQWSITAFGTKLLGTEVAGRRHPPQGWVSKAFGVREPAPVLEIRARLGANERIRTSIDLSKLT
jgi:hypothetical protein